MIFKSINKKVIGGSLILLVAFGLYNFFNFLFHIAMARLLSEADYGMLARSFTIIYVLAVFGDSIQTVLTKYAANEKNKGKLKNIIKKSFKKAFFISFGLFCLHAVVSLLLHQYIKIPYSLAFITGLMIFSFFFLPIPRGILQGKKKFLALGGNMVLESFVKILLSIVIVLLLINFMPSWKVHGAIVATIVATFVALAFGIFVLRDILKSKEEISKTPSIYSYTKPVFFITLIIVIFYNIDILLAGLFFDANIAGEYAIASMISKIIFMGTYPISKAMFSFSSEVKSKKNKNKSENILISASLILFVILIFYLIIVYLFPNLVIKVYSGKEAAYAIKIVFYLTIATSLTAIANLVLLYKLSKEKIQGYPILFIFVLIEIGLMSYFSNDLYQFSIAYIVASAIFLWGSVVIINK